MFLIFLGFIAVITTKVLESQEDKRQKIAEGIAALVNNEIKIAKASSDGYVRLFNLPLALKGTVYTISIIDDTELVVNYLDKEFVTFFPQDVQGNVNPGLNEISRVTGTIFLRHISECNDGEDNDGDDLIDGFDAGCDDLEDNDETNCGDGVCEGGETFETCPLPECFPVPSSCDGTWNEIDVTDGNECDGTSPIQGCDLSICVCDVGFTSDGVGGCDLNPPIIPEGIVLSIWPDLAAVVFFDSYQLPVIPSEFPAYGGRSINFSGVACTTIGYLQYVVETGRSYAQLVENSIIAPGESYDIWDADICSL